jgi:FkbM family methyltransferase
MDAAIDQLLASQKIEPVLVDIGASGGTPRIWQPIRTFSTYVGFDGDGREMHRKQEDEFRKAIFVTEVITADCADEVTFFLTRSPYCSSTLRPNTLVTDNFLSADSFIVEREEKAKASSLSAVMDRLQLAQVDWLKIDTQGTDLRIYNNLRQELRDKLLAIDIEPGLRGAYVGEDLFSDVHKKLVGDGYWLSNLKVCGLVRMRKSTLDWLAARDASMTPDSAAQAVRTTPGWTECRYLRSLESLRDTSAPQRSYVLLWVFALIDKQYGFCMDTALEYAKLFGRDDVSSLMETESLRRLDESRQALAAAAKTLEVTVFGRVTRKVRRVLSGGH